MVAQDLGVNLRTISRAVPLATATPASPSRPIKMLQSDPAPPAPESCCSNAWLPLVLAVGAVGLAAFVLNKKK
jgi:hypothetical protein